MATLDRPHARGPAEVALALGSDAERGLDETAAEDRRRRHGPNAIASVDRPGYASLIARQVGDPLVALLVAATALSAAIGEGTEAIVIGAIVGLNVTLGFVQEAKAERALRALREQAVTRASVIRGGREWTLASAALVPGDLVTLREGDRVPADGRLVRAEGLETDESALTGESLPVGKDVAPASADAPLAERWSMVYAGTGVTRGRGAALLTATGSQTELGRVVSLSERTKRPATPLERRLGSLARVLVVTGILIAVVLTGVLVARGEPLREAFLIAVAVAVAAVPEGLAATVTIALALGAHAMAARHAIVRRLAAIETLGQTTVICTDKTGTLTENRLRVAAILPAAGRSEADVLEAAVLASTADLPGDAGADALGDPVEGALLVAARQAGLERSRLLTGRRIVAERPFDPAARLVAILYEDDDGSRRTFLKGAPEVLFARVTQPDPALTARAHAFASEGLRVLAIGSRDGDGDVTATDANLALIGLAALHDPLRPAAAPAIRAARAAGVDVVMVTGDHPATAGAVARALGLPEDAVRARVTPEAKLRLVQDLQHAGETVAVTGDGINDAPALRTADVGVAMGRSGTEAAREAADVVLTDDDFATVVAAVSEGRRITENVRKVVAFLLSANLGEVLVFAIAIAAGIGVPMTVVQVLVVNLLTDGLPALALTRDGAMPDVMRRGPDRERWLFSPPLVAALAGAGVLVGIAALAALLAGRAMSADAAQTMTFSTVALSELVLVFSFRSVTRPAWRLPRNGVLLCSVAGSLVVLVLAIAAPGLRDVFGTSRLAIEEGGVVIGCSVLPFVVLELAKAAWRRRSRADQGDHGA
jgi:calcium-translocating P-type ATPase